MGKGIEKRRGAMEKPLRGDPMCVRGRQGGVQPGAGGCSRAGGQCMHCAGVSRIGQKGM